MVAFRRELQKRVAHALAPALVALAVGSPARADSDPALLLLGVDPTASDRIVSQGEWAANLVEALDLAPALPENHGVGDLFSLLCADRAELGLTAGGRRAPIHRAFVAVADKPKPGAAGGATRVVLNAPATALYQLTVAGAGPQRWNVDRRPIGALDATPLGVAQAPAVLPLSRGPHEFEVALPRGSHVDRVELSAFRSLCIAPADGWNAARALTFGAKARTLVRALGLERRLPEDGAPILIEGESFASGSPWGGLTNRPLGVPASSGTWATAIDSPAEFTYRIRLDQPGMFTLLARIHGSTEQIWSVDGRYRVTVAPGENSNGFAWSHVVTLPLGGGEHTIRALVARGSGIDLLRLARRRASDADYVSVLEGAGFDEGAPAAPVTRTEADANLANPNFRPLAEGFLARLTGSGGDEPLALVEEELEILYSRPLSPTLPPEL